MAPVRFALQAMLVVSMMMVVGWPEQRHLRASAFVKDRSDAAAGVGALDRESYDTPGARTLIGYGSASEQRIGGGAASLLYEKLYGNDIERRRRPSPGAVRALQGKLNGIMGYARGARNLPIAYARLILRDAETGKVEARAVANEQGRFAFIDVMPSRYVVELLNANGDVVATSEAVAIDIGEVRETVVSRSGRTAFMSFGGGRNLAPTAQRTVETAASQGVNRFTAPDRCASPPCNSSNP